METTSRILSSSSITKTCFEKSFRESLEGITQSLTGIEHERLESEQKIVPLKERINDLRLKEQEARLNEANFAEQLIANGGVEAELLPLVEKGSKASALTSDVTRITAEIELLGAVNLAALSELGTAQERKSHLDLQSQDLNEAVETLENAIRRIDRETRERLQDTFNQVNENFRATRDNVLPARRERNAL